MFLADYRISGLWPVLDPELSGGGFARRPGWRSAVSAASSRCSIRTTMGRCRLYLPLTVWGERLGVLLVELPRARTDPTVDGRVADIAGDLAVALRAADRETDRYRRARRRERLSMAAEMQWDLLPGRSVSHAAFSWPASWNRRTRWVATTSTGRWTATGSP